MVATCRGRRVRRHRADSGLAVGWRATVSGLSDGCRWPVVGLLDDCWMAVGALSVDCWWTVVASQETIDSCWTVCLGGLSRCSDSQGCVQ